MGAKRAFIAILDTIFMLVCCQAQDAYCLGGLHDWLISDESGAVMIHWLILIFGAILGAGIIFLIWAWRMRIEARQHIREIWWRHNKLKQQIIDQQRSVLTLRDKKTFFEKLILSMQEGFFVLTPEGEIVEANPAFCQMTGYARARLLGMKPPHRFWPDDIHAGIDQAFQKTIKGETVRLSAAIRTKDDERIPVIFSPACIRNGKGTVSHFIATITDVSALDKAEAALAQSEERLRMMLDATHDGVWDWDLQTGEVYFSPRYFTMLGYEADEFPASYETWTGLLHPEDRENAEQVVRDHLEGQTPRFEVEFRLRTRNAGWKWIMARGKAVAFETHGLPVRAIGTHVDISLRKQAEIDLKKSEEEKRAILEGLTSNIRLQDEKLDILWLNSAACASVNKSAKEMIGHKCYEFWGNGLSPCEDCPAIKAFKNKRAHEKRRLSADGRIWDSRSEPVFDDRHRVVGVISISNDVTDRIRHEAYVQQTQKLESMGTLAGGIAHDFNNILFPIIGFAEMLKEDIPEKSPLRDPVDEILKGSLRARDLVKQILVFSRQADQEIKPLRVQLIVKEALKLLRATLPATIEVRQEIATDCSPVLADPTQIHQLIMNLVTNAFHAMEDKGGSLTITLKEESRIQGNTPLLPLGPGPYIHISVADTGAGIPSELKDKIFEPYFTTKAKEKGTGLGLSVVHGIVKSCGGQITVNSTPGQGTVFDVYLPRIVSDMEPTESAIVETLPVGNERILLGDDEAPIVRIMQQILERLGYQVVARTSSVEALEAFMAKPAGFDLVITDFTMPNMTGLKLARELLLIRPDLPVIICTGFSEKISREMIRNHGINALLMKPIIRKELARVVRDVLDEEGVSGKALAGLP